MPVLMIEHLDADSPGVLLLLARATRGQRLSGVLGKL